MKKPSAMNAARLIEWLNTGWTVAAEKPPAEPVVAAKPKTEIGTDPGQTRVCPS